MRPRKIWYSVSVFSVYSTGSGNLIREHSRWASNLFHQKIMWYMRGWTELNSCGNRGYTRAVELHSVWEKDHNITAFAGNPVELPSTEKKKKIKVIIFTHIKCEKKRKEKSLRNNPRNSSLWYNCSEKWAYLPSFPSQNDTVSVFHWNWKQGWVQILALHF